MFSVTIRHIETSEDDQDPPLWIGDPITTLTIPSTVATEPKLAAAEGWVKSVGLARRAYLKETLNAPENVIEACTTVEGIFESDQLSPAPSYLCFEGDNDLTHWVLDNMVEAWFISVRRMTPETPVE
jgi:hypothetical protein